MYKYVFFDLDGTLIDSEEGIVKSVIYALESVDFYDFSYPELRKFIGPALSYSFSNFFGFDDVKTNTAIKKYRERYELTGIYENKLYDGVKEMLDALKAKGKIIALATAKPRPYAIKILDYFEIGKYFDYVSAVLLKGAPLEKKDIIGNALAALDILDKSAVAMIGDRKYDIIGAKSMGITAIGAGYGYGEHGELIEAGADYVFDSISSLKEFLFAN